MIPIAQAWFWPACTSSTSRSPAGGLVFPYEFESPWGKEVEGMRGHGSNSGPAQAAHRAEGSPMQVQNSNHAPSTVVCDRS